MSVSLEILEERITHHHIEEAIDIVKEIGRRKINEAVPLLIKHLQTTENGSLRNQIAIALSDIGNPEAVGPLISMARDPKTEGNRGTLLYALGPFDYSEYIEIIADFLFEDSFEARGEALTLMDTAARSIPPDVRRRCISKIRDEMENLDDKMEFLSLCLEVIGDP